MAGLAVALDPLTGELTFGDGVRSDPPGARSIADLKSVLADPNATGPDPAYRLYRGVGLVVDETRLADVGLRYDLTVTLPGTIGSEYVKTAGHVHLPAPTGFHYPEIYQVLHGRAAFLLQRMRPMLNGTAAVDEGWIILAGPGDAIQIPGDLGHLTVNIGNEPLVVSDLVAIASRNDYGPFQEHGGAAWYLDREPLSPLGFRIRSNPRYPVGLYPHVALASNRSNAFVSDVPLYPRAIASPAEFLYLIQPTDARS